MPIPKQILDLIADRTRALRNELGPADQRVMDSYLETVREIERRVNRSFEHIVRPGRRWKSGGFSAELAEGDSAFLGSALDRYLNFALRTFIPVVLLFVFINSVAVKYFAFDLVALFTN